MKQATTMARTETVLNAQAPKKLRTDRDAGKFMFVIMLAGIIGVPLFKRAPSHHFPTAFIDRPRISH